MTKRAWILGVAGMTVALSSVGCGGAVELEGDEANIAEVSEALTTAVYAEGLASGWENWSWRTSVSTAATSPVYGGTKSLSATYGINWAGLYLHSSTLLSGSNYDTLRFWIHGGTAGGQQIDLTLRNAADVDGSVVHINPPVAGQWTQVDVPLSSLGNLSQISAIVFQSTTSGTQPTFYLDDISFLGAPPPPPPPPPPPVGAIPQGLPQHVMVGLFENKSETWMQASGVPWDARYRYFVKGWVNNFGYGSYDGSWGLSYMQECDAQGYIPAIQYYQMNDEPGGGESAFLTKAQNATTMASYFGDFKILMQRAKDFNKPVMILLEADGFGYMEQQSQDNPNAYAAVAATGMPELAGLPNTVAGWGQAFLQIRKSIGASKAILGMHISGWATGKDITYGNVTDPLQPEVDKAHQFLAPLGLASNATGETYDLLVGDPLDRDVDYYKLGLATGTPQDRTWDPSDAASINAQSFNRYAEWLRLWNVKASKRWMLWQIPVGNSNHLNVYNNGGAREGYKDNRPEYFFGAGTPAHVQKFASSGVIGLLFGRGAAGQSSYTNDIYTDNQPFMKSRVAAFYQAGGVSLTP